MAITHLPPFFSYSKNSLISISTQLNLIKQTEAADHDFDFVGYTIPNLVFISQISSSIVLDSPFHFLFNPPPLIFFFRHKHRKLRLGNDVIFKW